MYHRCILYLIWYIHDIYTYMCIYTEHTHKHQKIYVLYMFPTECFQCFPLRSPSVPRESSSWSRPSSSQSPRSPCSPTWWPKPAFLCSWEQLGWEFLGNLRVMGECARFDKPISNGLTLAADPPFQGWAKRANQQFQNPIERMFWEPAAVSQPLATGWSCSEARQRKLSQVRPQPMSHTYGDPRRRPT